MNHRMESCESPVSRPTLRPSNGFTAKQALGLVLGCLVAFSANSVSGIQPVIEQGRPNILLIVADDMGYSDAGCFGGELDTPAIDRLAAEGVRFNNFYVNPMCVVTRTSLLTGHEHSQSNNFRNSIPLPHLLQRAGYRTSISGKWHQPGNPLDAGFDAFYGFLNGEINGWTGTYTDGKTLAIQSDREAPQPVAKDWYCSDGFASHAIEQIELAQQQGKPFFVYLPFNAPHGPLHAPRANVEKYAGRFAEGWDVLRQKRMRRMQAMGIIDSRYQSNVPEAEVSRWAELPADVQQREQRRFAAYAGMVDRMDQNIARVIQYLEDQKLFDNTLVIFLSDNGGNYSHGSIHSFDQEVPWNPKGPRPACATGWARLMNTPFSWYKTSAFRGGVSSPLIMRLPRQMTTGGGPSRSKVAVKPGQILSQRIHVSDLYPTLLQLVGQTYPEQWSQKQVKPLYGKSLLPLLEKPDLQRYAIHDDIFWGLDSTTKGLVQGDWKITSINDGPWRLYNLQQDPAESNDLSGSHAKRVAKMSSQWYQFARQETEMPPGWRKPILEEGQGWGLHRLRMIMPLVSVQPACSEIEVSLEPQLEFEFAQPVSFKNTRQRTLRLYSCRNPAKPVWSVDPDPSHSGEGQKRVKFQLPKLEPDTTYYFLSDRGWIVVGGRPAGPINDGAFFYRFRTQTTE